ncbi:MAG TPA: glutathione S-transferase N-terminal domain-containing protein [Burkholderiales bacterium]|nr:glutathione S-transferase N-terminal domain-containing protein [Burkholderiales bacterium]
MLTLYGMSTPNVQKVMIMLEETGLAHRLQRVDVWKSENYTPEFTRLNPVRKVPVLVDDEGPEGKPCTVFESGAILIYLAEKTGLFLPRAGNARYAVMQWLMVQMSGVGPMFGQYTHFKYYAPPGNAYSESRYKTQATRFFEAMDMRLAEADYLGGDYSIADMAVFPWTRDRNAKWGGNWEQQFPNVWRWHARVKARPAVQRMVEACDRLMADDAVSIKNASEEIKDRFLGRGAFAAP